jgi:hypothetical protein
MTDPERLLSLLEDAKKQLDESPSLLKNPEPPPGLTTKQWLESGEAGLREK